MNSKISDKDKKVWKNFISNNEKIPDKDLEIKKEKVNKKIIKKIDRMLQVTVDFVGEVITCIKDKEKKIISGDPEKIKKIYDTWIFSRDTQSSNPNWQLIETLT